MPRAIYSVLNLPQPLPPFFFPTLPSAWIHALLLIWAGICGAANSAGASRRGLGFDGGFDRFGGGDDDEFGAAFGAAFGDDAFDGGFEDDERAAYRAMGMGMGGMMMGAVGDLLQNKKREPPKSYAFVGRILVVIFKMVSTPSLLCLLGFVMFRRLYVCQRCDLFRLSHCSIVWCERLVQYLHPEDVFCIAGMEDMLGGRSCYSDAIAGIKVIESHYRMISQCQNPFHCAIFLHVAR